MKRSLLAGVSLALLLGGCKKAPPPPLYLAVPVAHRDITVSALASGAVEAITVVNVKSRASGTILRMPAQTGLHVRAGDTLVIVDRRDPTNSFNQAQSDLAVARANLQNATMTKANLTESRLHRANLTGAKLTEANLSSSNLQAAILVNTALSGADLSHADLQHANLTGASLAESARAPEALPLLLELVTRSRKFKGDAARTAMLTLFKYLGPEHPAVQEYRRRLQIVA